MPKLHANKSIILKTLYGFLVGMFIIAGVCELYFVVQRRLSFQRMKEYAISRGNIYFARNATEAFAESLWEKPWESYRPDAILDVKVGQERYVVKINSQGFRTREFEKEKPAGVYRVICIGGSTTVQGKTNQDTYPALLEKTLQKRYPEFAIEVLNFGISNTRSDYWLRRVDRLFGFQPDLIIQYNAINDISWKLMGSGPCTHTFTYRGINALNYSFLFQKLYPIDGSLFDECFMTILHNFSRMSEIARSKGSEYIVGSFAAPDYDLVSKPFKTYLNFDVQTGWGRELNLKYYSGFFALLTRYNSLFRSYVEQHNLNAVFVDEYISDPELFIDVCHMAPEGIHKFSDVFFRSVSNILDAYISSNDKDAIGFH